MEAKELYTTLKTSQEARGFFFNRDMEKTYALLEALLFNRERYGYMACPCRLAKEDREADRDIICPCAYREADVQDYGNCYCGLYVAHKVHQGLAAPQDVPERRPAERC
ncbi:MAG TPA: ferredoxin:thioredoxin reductase [Desulfobulbaceae bacterium]|nr:ferredoxin:thioredoxin reductase [Desulfobulbaceae bacterium]